MARIVDLPLKVKVQLEGGLSIGPNDILAIRFPMNTSDAAYDEARQRLDAWLPEDLRGRVVIVVCEEFAKVER